MVSAAEGVLTVVDHLLLVQLVLVSIQDGS